MGRGIIISLLGPMGGLSELIHINTSCPWHILKTGKVLVLMIVMMMILECLLCQALQSLSCSRLTNSRRQKVYIYIYERK